jgi:hypothetical protein
MPKQFEKSFGGRELYYPCDLQKDRIGDCVFRAIALATETDYKEVFQELFRIGLELGNMPNSKQVYEHYLTSKGWVRNSPKTNKRKKYTLNAVPIEPNKNYIFKQANHLVAVVDGVVKDSWDSRLCSVYSYYTKPNQ